MKRDLFIKPKVKWGPVFLHRFIGHHPGLSSTQIRDLLLVEHGFHKSVPEVHGLIYQLRKQKKVTVNSKTGPKGGMTYEAV